MRTALALAALLVLPGAQALAVEVDAPQDMLVPLEEYDTVVRITVECGEWFLAAAASRGPAPVASVNYTRPHEGFSLSGPTTRAVPRGECVSPQSGETDVDVPLVIVGATQVPGMEEHVILVDVDFGDQEQQEEFRVKMAWWGLIGAKAPVTIKQAGPQKQIEYAVEIQNFGNSRTKVMFDTDGATLGQILLPDPLILDAPGGPQDVATAIVVYNTPYENGANQAAEDFTITVWPENPYARDERGNETALQFQARTKGMYVPGPALPLLAVGLLLALRARRD